MNKFGPHFQRFTSEMRDLIAEWQPPLVVWVDPNRYGVEEIRRVSPGTFIIGRKFEEGGWNSPNLKERAYYWADRCAEMGPCHAYYAWNEPISHDDKANFGRLDDFHMWFRERILQYDMEAVGLNMATGNFTRLDDIAACFPNTCASFRHLGIHEYDWIVDPIKRPVDADRLGYYWERWPYWLADINRNDVTLWITECGMTQAVHAGRPDEGWRSGADGMTDDDYIAWADWYNSRFAHWESELIGGAALFNFAGWGWATFEHLGWPRLGEILALDAGPSPPPQPPPQPPSGGTEMDIKVYDMHGQEQDFEWAEGKYGVAFRRAEVEPGQWVFRLVELREKSGPASLITKVVDVDGKPMADMDVAFYWPDAPDPPDPPTEVYAHDWHRNFVHGPTGGTGDVGPGMGPGAYHGIGEGGPHAVWVRDPETPTDLCYKLGMLAGTPHDHLDQKFKLEVEGDDGGGNGDDGEERFIAVGEPIWTPGPHNYIRITTDDSLMDMRGNLRCGGWEIPDPIHPREMDGKAGFEFDCAYVEDESRVYEASIFYLPTGEVVGGPWEFPFSAGMTGVWEVTVEWREPDGEPPVEPPGELPALCRLMAAACREAQHAHGVLAECLDKLAELAGG